MTLRKAAGKRADKLSLKCFGVGDGWPSSDRDHSSFLYQFRGQSILIDCGEPISRSFKAYGLEYDTIDRILISHLHLDHLGGFFMLVQGFWLEGRKKDLPVHLPSDGIDPVRRLLEVGCIFDELLRFRLSYQPLQAGKSIASGPVQITPFPTSHLADLRVSFQRQHPQKFQAYSFLLETDDLRVGHSADIGAAEDLAPLVERPLDLLVCELAHVEPKEIFRFLEGRDISRIVFVHMARQHLQHFAETEALAERSLGGMHLTWARCGQQLEVTPARTGNPGKSLPSKRAAAKP